MKPLFLLRLVLDFVAAGLLLAAMAYNWSGNLTHEVIGTLMFGLLVAHNVFNRRWYGTLRQGGRQARSLITKTANLSLLVTMLLLLVSSVVISQAVFSFLPLATTFTWRQVHALVGYLALLIAAVHLGLHWTMLMGVARTRLGITADNRLRAYALRALALLLAAYGIYSLFAVNVGTKLTMQMTMEFWDFKREAMAFFLHHFAIIALGAAVAHYGLRLVQAAGRNAASR